MSTANTAHAVLWTQRKLTLYIALADSFRCGGCQTRFREYPGLMASSKFGSVIPLFCVALSLASCKRPKAEIDGIGTFKLGHTTIAEVGACGKQGTLSYCSNNGAVAIGGQSGTVDLYFRHGDDDAARPPRLTEILVIVNRCKVDPIESELRKELGDATAQVGGTTAWVGKKATIIARLPAEKGICEITFLDPTETERIAEVAPSGVDLTSPKK